MKQKHGAYPDRIIYKGLIISILLLSACVALAAQLESTATILGKILDGFKVFLTTCFGLLIISVPIVITFGSIVYKIITTKYSNSVKRNSTAFAFMFCAIFWSFIYRGLPFTDLEEIVTILLLATIFSVPTIITIYTVRWLKDDDQLYDDLLDR